MVDYGARVWLAAIRDEIASIRVLTDNATAAGMVSFPMRRALQHSLLVAEATRQVPRGLKATRPDLPWARLDHLDGLLGHELSGADGGIEEGGEPWPLISDHLEDLDAAAESWLAEPAAAG